MINKMTLGFGRRFLVNLLNPVHCFWPIGENHESTYRRHHSA